MDEQAKRTLIQQMRKASNEELIAMHSVTKDPLILRAITTILVNRKVWKRVEATPKILQKRQELLDSVGIQPKDDAGYIRFRFGRSKE